jgi:hypothetical protein
MFMGKTNVPLSQQISLGDTINFGVALVCDHRTRRRRGTVTKYGIALPTDKFFPNTAYLQNAGHLFSD